jgi:hypothetical protein
MSTTSNVLTGAGVLGTVSGAGRGTILVARPTLSRAYAVISSAPAAVTCGASSVPITVAPPDATACSVPGTGACMIYIGATAVIPVGGTLTASCSAPSIDVLVTYSYP